VNCELKNDSQNFTTVICALTNYYFTGRMKENGKD